MAVTLEEVLDKIATTLITKGILGQDGGTTLAANQKTIRDGIISAGRSNSEKLLLFQTDVEANEESIETGTAGLTSLKAIVDSLQAHTIDDIVIDSSGESGFSDMDGAGYTGTTTNLYHTVYLNCYPVGLYTNITSLIQDGEGTFNVSQFMNLMQSGSVVSPAQAHEFLDTNIFELLPGGQTRQDRIDDFFNEFQNLTAGPPIFDADVNGMVDEDFSSDDYSTLYDISSDNPEGNIPRLDADDGDDNISQTLQSLRDTLDTYLVDIDEELDTLDDQRPTYKNESDGYLKFRNLNQGIIIRNTNQEFVEGLNPDTKDYLGTGFTITMWVRFLDKTSSGTLFNFGNPTRTTDPMGFKLDTLISDSDERYLRLLVYDGIGTDGVNPFGAPHWFDSHMGITSYDKISTTSIASLSSINITQYTEVPIDFSEWYFICATYNPVVNEQGSTPTVQNADFWRNNIVNGTSTYIAASGFGNRSKVEIISRTDLLRARGYKSS